MPKTVAGTAADPTVNYVKLEIEGETYSLIFDFNAIATAEKIAKVNLLEAIEFHNINAGQYRGLLYAALLKAQPKITLSEVGDLITLDRMPAMSDALLQAWKNSMQRTSSENPPEPEPSPAE